MAKWTREHEEIRRRILERQERDAAPFEDLSDEAQEARRALPFLEWCATYLPHYFTARFARFHQRMVDAAGEPGMPTFVAAFRGCGKSVLLALARPLYRTLRGEVPYWIYGARVQKLAAQNMDYVRLEIQHNKRIACDYGSLKTDGAEEVWIVELPRLRNAQGQWARQSCKFEAFGIGMSPRGRRHGQWRPLEFLGDDLEDAELARNPEREKNLWDWMMDEVVPALEPETYTFTVLGTIFGPGCMMERAKELAARTDPAGRVLAKRVLQPATEGGRSVWPERFSNAALARVRATIGLRNWNRNFALIAEDPDKPFQADWLLDFAPADIDEGKLLKVCFLDPALSESPKGCPRALVAVGADRQTGQRYILDAWVDRGSPETMLDKLFEFHARFNPYLMGIEINGGYALLRDLLRIDRRGDLPVRYVTQTENKDVRIMGLQAPVEQGKWRFPRNPSRGVRTLIEQMLNYPDGFVDGPDALASADALLPAWYAPRERPGEYRRLQGRTNFAYV